MLKKSKIINKFPEMRKIAPSDRILEFLNLDVNGVDVFPESMEKQVEEHKKLHANGLDLISELRENILKIESDEELMQLLIEFQFNSAEFMLQVNSSLRQLEEKLNNELNK